MWLSGGGQINEKIKSAQEDAVKEATSSAAADVQEHYGDYRKRACMSPFAGPYGSLWHMLRVGHLVHVYTYGGNGWPSAAQLVEMDEVLPSGWRPIDKGEIIGFCPPDNNFIFTIDADGGINLLVQNNTSWKDYKGQGCWFTDDPFPINNIVNY